MKEQFIIFVCEHGAAKSILASAYFNKLASEKGLPIRSIARGTFPDEELSPRAVTGLKSDGLVPVETSPIKLSPNDMESAHRVVAFCELPIEIKQKIQTESWNDVPAVSDGYESARDAIMAHLDGLISSL